MKKVAAVVISYNPNIDRMRLGIEKLLGQVGTVIVVDNGSATCVGQMVETIANACLVFRPLGINMGIGAALNVGINIARGMGAEFALLMDQDSLARAGMVETLLRTYYKLIREGSGVAAVGPRFIDSETGSASSHARFARWHVGRVDCGRSESAVRVDFLITSGSLIPIEVLETVGGMDESLFIDHVDTEWVLRAKSLGYDSFGDCVALMEHSLGEYRINIWCFRWREVPVHRPFRYYYIFRNSCMLYRRPYMVWAWKRVDVVRLVQICVFTLVFGPQRLLKMHMMWRGICDGLRGRGGSMVPIEGMDPVLRRESPDS